MTTGPAALDRTSGREGRTVYVLPDDSGSGRLQWLLFGASVVAAFLLGFVLVSPERAGQLIVHGGYYYILGVFVAWIYYAWRVTEVRSMVWTKRKAGIVAFLIGATAFAVWSDTFAHKLLFDEYVLQGTAWQLHLAKEVSTPVRAFEFAGTWVTVDTFLDKRPYFFAFLVSLLHDLTGFRLANVFVLNVALAFVVLASTYALVRALAGRVRPALLSVALLATLPLFGQNATGGSMELMNLAMIGIVMVTATSYLREPNPDHLSLLVLGAVLLAQSRYESVLFVLPSAVVIVLGWWRAGRVFFSWPAIVAPLLLVPYVWHDRYVSISQHLWQLREGESSRFSLEFLPRNLEGARNFFFSVAPLQPNSLWLVILGLLGLGWAIVRLGRTRLRIFLPSTNPEAPVTFLFAVTVLANLGILMFYYWSRLDEPVATRFALPLFLILSVVAGWFVQSMDSKRIPSLRIAGLGLAVWLLTIAPPIYAQRLYTTRNIIMHELAWELEQIQARPGPVLLITSKAALVFLLEKIPTLNIDVARFRGAQIEWHMRHETFREVLVSQLIRPTSAEGDRIVEPDDVLPESFQLETVEEKRFGARWVRLSRLVEIVPLAADQTEHNASVFP